MLTTPPTLGDNLARLRTQRRLTQEGLAERSGVSVSVVKKLERGNGDARVATLHKLARALDVPTSRLFGPARQPKAMRDLEDDVSLIGLREILAPGRDVDGAAIGTADVTDAPTPDETFKSIRAVDRAFNTDDYAMAFGALPALLTEASVLRAGATGAEEADAARLQSQAYALAGMMLTGVRKYDLGQWALDRALDAARSADDDHLAGWAVFFSCWLLVRESRLATAARLSVAAADRVEPPMRTAAPERLITWGRLLLMGAAATARDNRPDEAWQLLDAAAAAAARLGHGDTGPAQDGPGTRLRPGCSPVATAERTYSALPMWTWCGSRSRRSPATPAGRLTSPRRSGGRIYRRRTGTVTASCSMWRSARPPSGATATPSPPCDGPQRSAVVAAPPALRPRHRLHPRRDPQAGTDPPTSPTSPTASAWSCDQREGSVAGPLACTTGHARPAVTPALDQAAHERCCYKPEPWVTPALECGGRLPAACSARRRTA
jgi:transcriptional regulator with XRE-family HTH domain